MKVWLLIFSTVWLTACGNQPANVENSGTLRLGLMEDSEILALAGQVTSVYLVAFGAQGQVTFSTSEAPPFVSISGNIMTIVPQRSDMGTYPCTVTATDEETSDTKRVFLVVDRQDSPPHFVTHYAADTRGLDAFANGCLDSVNLWGTLTDLASEMDAVRVEAEVVPEGSPFTGEATHVSSSFSDYRPAPGDIAYIDYELSMADLLPGQRYNIAVRAVDELQVATDWQQLSSTPLGYPAVDTFACAPFALVGELSVCARMTPGAERGTVVTCNLRVDGTPPGEVTFSAPDLPSFASISGSTLTIAPSLTETPEFYSVLFTAAAGGITMTAVYHIQVW